MTPTERRIIDEARNEGDRVSMFDIHPSRDFDDPNKCADFIMDQLYDGPRHPDDGYGRGDWVVAILGHTGLFFAYKELDALDEGYDYLRITWDPDGNRILEGER